MRVEEIKKSILEKVEKFSKEQLIQLNEYVDAIDKLPKKEYDLLPHVDQIVQEREAVLKKLAE